jgi:hypothetical protein
MMMLQNREEEKTVRGIFNCSQSSGTHKPYLPFQLHLVMLFRPSASRTWLERLAQQRFGFGLHLSEQDEAVFVEFFAAGLGLDGGDAVLDFAEIVDDLPDAQGSRLVD